MSSPAEEEMGLAKERMARVKWVGVEDARINSVEAFLAGLSQIGEFQAVNAAGILGEEHLRFACYEALRAFAAGRNFAETLSMEVLLKAACTSQIKVAISRLGVKAGCGEVVLVGIDVDDEAMERAVKLTGGGASSRPLDVDAEKRKRIMEILGLREPAEKTLLEAIALSSLH